MKRNIIFCVAFATLATFLPAQDTPLRYRVCDNCSTQEGGDNLNTAYTYGGLQIYGSQDVTSDFGARYAGYDWHKGIDFRPLQFAGTNDGGRGTAVIAAETGDVFRITATQGFKYIVIDGEEDFGYGHIFNSRNPTNTYLQSGSMVLKAMDSPFTDFYAIINLNTSDAIGQREGTVTLNGTQYDVEDEVTSTDQTIAAMGGSGGVYQENDPFPVHLHLYHFQDINNNPLINEAYETNCLDPLHVIQHEETSYEIKFHTEGENFGDVSLNYPGSSPTKFRVRAVMENATNTAGVPIGENGSATRYGNVVMNLDNIQLLIKPSHENEFQEIRGKEFYSRIRHGALDDNEMYPTYLALNNQRGNWNHQSIAPFAYTNHPYDDFYFTDFITRIHKDDPMDGGQAQIANCPEDARYNDGRYELKAQATDVRGNDDFEETANFTLDNFQPYIAGLSLYSNDQLLYTRNWSCNGGCGGITLGQSPITGVSPSDWSSWISNPNSWLDIKSSEPLEVLTLDIIKEVGGLSQILAEEVEGTSDVASNEWHFDLSEYFEKFQEKIIFRFNGRDLSGNSLLDLSNNLESCVRVPVRDSESSWHNPDGLATGSDQIHAICFSCEENPPIPEDCGVINIIPPTGPCLDVNINIRDASGSNTMDGQIDLTIAGGVPPYQYFWADGSTQNNLEDLNPGEYCVTITDALCCFHEECLLVEVCAKELSIDGEIQHMCINGSPTGSIDATILGGGGSLTYLWNTGQTTQDLNNIETADTYYVTVTDACGNSETQPFDVGIFFGAPLDNYIHHPTSCNSKDGDIDISFHGNHPEGGVPPYTYQWSTGEETANITSLGAGTYILTITDSEGCAETFTFNLVPEGSPRIILTEEITPSCEGENNGAIEISVYTENAQNYPGQYPAYEILWYNSSGQLIFTDPNNNYDSEAVGLPPDSYTVTVRDISDINVSPFSGCISSATFVVEERPSLGPFTVAPQITPSCYGDNTGSIYLNTSGGNPPYTYNWDNGEHTQSIDHLSSPASYSVTITDDCGRQIVHAPLSVPSYSEIINTIVSEGGCPGMIELETSGGTPPYSYLWSNGQTASTATGLANGDSYFLTVTDAAGCTKQEYFIVPIDPEEAFEILISDIQHATSPSAADGRVTVSADEPGSITYLWDNDINGPTLTGISSGSYKVTATNAAGCSVARTIDIMDCSEVENFPDFEILASGGLFSNAADEETTLSTLIKEKGEAFFTEEIPGHYSIRWEFPNGNLIGNAPELTVDAATVLANRPTFLEVGWASINLVVSNGCTEKKANHYFIICGQVDEQFANTVLSSFFFIESAVIHPCSGFSDGSITIEIPNPEGLEVSVTRDGIVLPAADASGFSVVQETGLSAGAYNFEIAIGECVNSFTFNLTSEPTSLIYQTYNSATKKCEYKESCRGIGLGHYEETAFFNHDNATNFPCEIPILCGENVVSSQRFSRRTVRGFEYKLILQQLLNFPDFSPFSPDYIEHLILEARRIDDCDRIRYCPATMEKTASILPSLASDNGIENGGNGCFRVHCSGFLGIGFHFDVCTNDLNVPEDLFLDEFDPGTNTCLPEQANLFELYHAWQELDAFIDVPNFHETELHDILLQFGNTPEAKCATIIYCVNDLDQILYNDVESVDCTDQIRYVYTERVFSFDPFEPFEENIPVCEPPIYISPDPEGNVTYEVVFCNINGNVKEHVIDYGYFPPSPEGGPEFNPSDIIVDKFSLDTFYIEKLASLGFVINEGRVVPKPIISTDYGQSLYYDYNHTGKVLSKRKIRNTAFHIDNWDTGQALFCFINEAAKEYEIAYFDSLTAWSHILGSDIGINISHFSKDGHKITITGSFAGTLKYDENTIAAGETEQNTMFIATIDMNSQFVKLNTIIGIDSHSGFSVSKNMGGKLAIGGQYHTSDVFFDDVPFNLPSSEGVFLTTYDILSGVEEPNIFISSQNGLQLLKLSQDSTSNNLTAIIKAQGGNEIEINGEPKTLPEGGSYFALNFSNGELNWIFPITSDGIDEAGFDIVYGKEESIFIGLTFENSITIEDEVITSQGGKDIVIMKINGLSGAIDWRRTYGSSADENVVELLYDESTLFFAGELTGHEIYREIGNYNFYNPVPSDSSKAYLSYIFDSKNPSVNRLNLEANIPTERLNEDVKRSVRIEKVFPNPFSRSFTLILNSPLDCESDISLFNLFGEKILSRKYNFTSGENRINYEVPNDMPNGIYYIHMDIDGVKSKNHKLIHIRR